ncbi:MAG: TRAP transporter substrate-binding protein [Bacillota bacterium]
MKRFKKIISLAIVCMLVFALAACSGGTKQPEPSTGGDAQQEAQQFSFNLGIDSPEDTVTFIFAKKFSELVEAKSNGNMKVQVYANGQLGGDRELIESTQAGNVDFVVQTTAPQVNFIPELAVFDMASVFPNVETARKALDSEFEGKIGEYYEKAGLKLLGYADQGFRQMTSNKKIQSIDDFKGIKIRTMENPYHLEYWKSVGANPTPMAWGEVYIGLQQGTIDAQENPYEVIVANKIYEQQKYVINTNHVLHILSLIMGNDKFNSLPADYQQIITDAAKEAKEYARAQADERIDGRVKIMNENGVEIVNISPELQAEMAKRAESEYAMIRGKIGDDLVDGLLAAVQAAK